MNNISESPNYTAIPPGVTLKEILNDRNISNEELAYRLDLSSQQISDLLSGEGELSECLADKLELALGISAVFWINLEASYRGQLEKVKDENNLKK